MLRVGNLVLLSLVSWLVMGGCGVDQPGGIDSGSPEGDGAGVVVLSGQLNPGQAAKARPRMQDLQQELPFTIVAQSDQTGTVYHVETSADGQFELELPADELGNTFIVMVQGPDGRAIGPVVFGEEGGQGITGLAMERDANLGTIELPDDPQSAAIAPGADGDATALANSSLTARLNDAGAPLGLASVGKGPACTTTDLRTGLADADGDGLIDLFDADDNGSGLVDDFDKGDDWTGVSDDFRANFFMNLKIQAEEAQTYYTGTDTEIAAARSRQTVITFEVLSEPGATRAITAARLLEVPGPAYLTIATVLPDDGSGPTSLWRDLAYAFTERTDRFDAFVVPNAVLTAGDTFALEVLFDDGSSERASRMINYVFTNIPALVEYGTPTALTAFDIADPAANGSPSAPLPIDGGAELVLVFRPPPDETGAPITDMPYSFQFFYNDDAGQQGFSEAIDVAATWPTEIPGWGHNMSFWVTAEELGALSDEGTYAVTLPQELFVDEVVLADGTSAAVGSYKIDITAEAPTGNAAIMIMLTKQ
jgi:hypothetical protein